MSFGCEREGNAFVCHSEFQRSRSVGKVARAAHQSCGGSHRQNLESFLSRRFSNIAACWPEAKGSLEISEDRDRPALPRKFDRKRKSTVVIEDMASDQYFANSPLLSEKGVHFCAGEPLLNRNGNVMGSLLVLDTRTRNISQQEEELLHTGAKAAVEALEVRMVPPPIETTIKA
jgi:GAF domain-containing protein